MLYLLAEPRNAAVELSHVAIMRLWPPRFQPRHARSKNDRTHYQRLSCLAPGLTLCYGAVMTKMARQLLERVASWPEEDIEKLEEAARRIEAWRSGEYDVTADELQAIDEAIAELDRGEVATPEQVRAAFAAFRTA